MDFIDWFHEVRWERWAPTIVALVGIPLTAVLALWREGWINRQKFEQEAEVREDTQKRDDQLSQQSREREEAIRRKQQQREDARRFMAERIQAYDELIRAGDNWWKERASLIALDESGKTDGETYTKIKMTIIETIAEGTSALNRIMMLSTNPVRRAAKNYWGSFPGENKMTIEQMTENRETLFETIREELRSQEVDAMFS
jgi:hypothetical protein